MIYCFDLKNFKEVWMKKKIVAGALMLCLACGSIFAFGIGIQGGSNVYGYATGYSDSTGLDITFKLNKIPLLFAVGIPHFYDPFALGISGDYWIINPSIVGGRSWSLNWYIGAGIFANFFIPKNSFYFGFGLRVPIGLNLFFLRRILEAYVQIAPGIEIDIQNGVHPEFILPINYGLRVWIQ